MPSQKGGCWYPGHERCWHAHTPKTTVLFITLAFFLPLCTVSLSTGCGFKEASTDVAAVIYAAAQTTVVCCRKDSVSSEQLKAESARPCESELTSCCSTPSCDTAANSRFGTDPQAGEAGKALWRPLSQPLLQQGHPQQGAQRHVQVAAESLSPP